MIMDFIHLQHTSIIIQVHSEIYKWIEVCWSDTRVITTQRSCILIACNIDLEVWQEQNV